MKSLVSLIVVAFLFAACGETQKQDVKKFEYIPVANRSALFNNYLSNQFGIEIPVDSQQYVLVSNNGCKGYIQKSLLEIDTMKTTWLKLDECIFISSTNSIIPEVISKRFTVLYDTLGKLNSLNLRISNVTIIETYNHKIDSIYSLELSEK